jgi:hypothetical protein
MEFIQQWHFKTKCQNLITYFYKEIRLILTIPDWLIYAGALNKNLKKNENKLAVSFYFMICVKMMSFH